MVSLAAPTQLSRKKSLAKEQKKIIMVYHCMNCWQFVLRDMNPRYFGLFGGLIKRRFDTFETLCFNLPFVVNCTVDVRIRK